MAFQSLYQFATSSGTVIPSTGSVKNAVENAFKDIFGADFSVDATTPQGRLIEAITMLFVDVLGITAMNANALNPDKAVGQQLDNLAALFNLARSGVSDSEFRNRIKTAQSMTNGYAQSIINELSRVESVGSICVLENGHGYPAVLPNAENGIAVAPHSIFVCVGRRNANQQIDRNAVASAVYRTKSAGCGYTDSSEYGTPVEVEIVDPANQANNVVKFYEAQQKNVSISVRVNASNYTGLDAEQDVSDVISRFASGVFGGSSMSKIDIANAIASSGIGVYARDVSIAVGGAQVGSVTIKPYESISVQSIQVVVE